MNNLAYMGQDGQTVAPKVQELLGKELASNSPIHFAVESEGAGGASARSVLTDVATSLFGEKSSLSSPFTLILSSPERSCWTCICCGRDSAVSPVRWRMRQR